MKFIAHRGKDKHSFYENSKEALCWCLKQSYIDGVELDVRMTKDHQFVLWHNSSILYLGIENYFIANETLEKLKSINFGTLENPHYLDSLEEFLDSIQTDKIIILDIKKEIGEVDELISSLLKVLEKYSYLNIYLCSFREHFVKLCATMCKTSVGLLVSDWINKKKDYTQYDFLSVSKGAYRDIASSKKKIVWTINKKEDLRGISSKMWIITDNAYRFVSK